ncbi:MAG: hypothetical protein ACYDA8_05350, partial [Deferrisomatales bacterium]
AVGVNDLGEVVGQSDTTGGVVNGVLWNAASPSAPSPLAALVAGGHSAAYDIDDNGRIVGEAEKAGANPGDPSTFVPVLWTVTAGAPGTPRELPLLEPGTWGAAYGINTFGQIVGEAERMVGGNRVDRPVLWTLDPVTGAATVRELPRLTGTSATAYFIDDSGHIAGEADDRDGAFHGVLWRVDATGMVAQTVDLGGLPGGPRSVAFGVNAAGQVVGEAMDANGLTRSVLWQVVGGGAQISPLSAADSSASAISPDGRVAGWNAAGPYLRASMWNVGFADPTAAVPLLVPPLSTTGADQSRGFAITAAGGVAGMFRAADGDQAFVATP